MKLSTGNTWLGQYHIRVIPPLFEESKACAYYQVLLSRYANGWHFHANPLEMLGLDLSDKNPLFVKAFPPKLKKYEEEPALSPAELEFRAEYNSFKHRKDQGWPMTLLSKRHAEKLWDMLVFAWASQ
jgi:hypothetical protein